MARSLVNGLLSALVGVSLAVGAPGSASASSATPAAANEVNLDENGRLERGETVVFDQRLDRGGRHYVGGTTYTIIDASQGELETLFGDMHAYQQLLPRTKQARLVGMNNGDLFVELRQGNSLLETSYTIRVRREPLAPESRAGEGAIYRFWLDRSKPHGIEDAWGYFRLEPLGEGADGQPRTLVTYGILVDIGPGLVRDMFEERLRQLALTVPQAMRRYARAHFRPRPAGSGSRA
jgi:hypothetical protein